MKKTYISVLAFFLILFYSSGNSASAFLEKSLSNKNRLLSSFENADGNFCRIVGWATETGTEEPITVSIYKDAPFGQGGTLIEHITADIYRDDIPFNIGNNHGFRYTFDESSGMFDGQPHKIYLYALQGKGERNILLHGSPKEILCRENTPINDAGFISWDVPDTMIPGKRYQISMTFKNTGSTTWRRATKHKLGSRADKKAWFPSQIALAPNEDIKPQQKKLFTFKVTPPHEHGVYNFQWQMLQARAGWFKELTPNINIPVTSPPVGNLETVDHASCTIEGWAKDTDTPDPVSVHIYKDGKINRGGTFVASKIIDNGHNFQYTFDESSGLFDGQVHEIFIYGMDKEGIGHNTLLDGSPKKILCLSGVKKPNIINIIADDLGYGDIHAFNPNGPIHTPNLDQLVQDGMKFTQYYTNGPYCSPTRVAFLTGAYPQLLNFRQLCSGMSRVGIPLEFFTMPEMFREAGYYTFHVGKWHVGNPQFNPDFSSISAGFNESAIKNRAYYYYSELAINHDFNDIEYLMDTHLTKGLTDKAIEKIEAHITGENNNLPFFLNLWYMAPHSKMGGPGLPPEEEPYQAPEDWLDFYNTPEYDGFGLSETAKAYAALVSYLDEQIGVLLHELDNRGLTDNTIVVFSSDNGPTHIVEYNKYWSNDTPEGDLRGRKGMFFEGGIRVPLIVKWPNKVPSSTENASVLMTADFYPTFAELAGIQSLLPGLVPEDQLRAGKSFVDTLINNSESPREETLFWEGLAGRDVSTNPVENENKFGIRKRNWKMVRETRGKEGYEIGRPEPYLFDLQDDPGESTDLASAYPEIVQGLLDEYSEWRKEIGTIRYHIDSILGDADILDGVMRFNEGAILLEDNPRFDFYSRAFSIAFLVKPTDSDNLHHSGSVLLEKSGSWRLSILPGGRVQIVLYGDDGQGVVLKSEDSLQLNTWNRVVVAIAGFVYEESLVKLYVNQGAPKEGRGPAPVGVAISANPISIGNELHMYIPFKGMIKDLKLFGMSLTEEEIEELFQYRNSLTHSPRL